MMEANFSISLSVHIIPSTPKSQRMRSHATKGSRGRCQNCLARLTSLACVYRQYIVCSTNWARPAGLPPGTMGCWGFIFCITTGHACREPSSHPPPLLNCSLPSGRGIVGASLRTTAIPLFGGLPPGPKPKPPRLRSLSELA